MNDPKKPDFLKMLLLNQGSGVSGHEKVVSKELFNKENIQQKTRLDVSEIQLVNRGLWFADYFRAKGFKKYGNMLERFYTGTIELRPSLDGGSRTEFVDIFRNELEQVKEEKQGIKIK